MTNALLSQSAAPEKFTRRIHTPAAQSRDIRKFLAHSDAFVETLFAPAISKAFFESINLAVTQVNGCTFCSYTHAKNALESGVTEDEVEFLLSGNFDHASREQLEALLFAQHYAETQGNPDPQLEQKMFDVYGAKQTRDILSAILFMTLTNLHGNTFEAFKLRLRGRGLPESSFWRELVVLIRFFQIVPVILFKAAQYKIQNRVRQAVSHVKST